MLKTVLAGVALLACWVTPSTATVLTFDTGVGDNTAIAQSYGDNVVSFSNPPFSYGAAGGLTPHVSVSYGPTDVSTGSCAFDTTACLYQWASGFGDLTNVIAQSSRGVDSGIIDITLTADPGWAVLLASFDMAVFPGGLATSHVINSVQVTDGSGNILFSQLNPTIISAGHNSFTPDVSGAVLHILIDASNVLNNQAENIGLDNIQFAEHIQIPEPSTWILFGTAFAALGLLRRR